MKNAPVRKFNPIGLYTPQGHYFNAVEVGAGARIVYSSGIIGVEQNGKLISDKEYQIRQAWLNVAAFLDGCDMTPHNLVRLKMHLTDREDIAISKAARVNALGIPMHCAVTGVIVKLFDPDLFIEIDVVAAA